MQAMITNLKKANDNIKVCIENFHKILELENQQTTQTESSALPQMQADSEYRPTFVAMGGGNRGRRKSRKAHATASTASAFG